jgi:hypothetical protein
VASSLGQALRRHRSYWSEADTPLMQSILSSVARLQVGVVGRNRGSRASELKMYWTKPP